MSLRPTLERLVETGELGEHTEDLPRADGRRYARRVVAISRSMRDRGLDRAAPIAVVGSALRAARQRSPRRVAELAEACGITPATWRSWEARGVPRARIVEVGEALGAPAPRTIRETRDAAGWTQRQLGKLVGVNFGAVQAWEAGVRPVPPGRIALLLAALDSAEAVAVDRHERLVRQVVDEVASRPGVSESELRHDHRQRGGRVPRDGNYAAALDDAKRRGLVVEGLVTEAPSGYPKTRTGLFTPDQAPGRVKPMTGDELGRRRSALELTQAKLAKLCGVAAVTVLHWEKCRAGAIPEHGAERARRALAIAEAAPRPSVLRRSRLLRLIGENPGIAKHRLGGRGSGDTELLDRDLAALVESGEVVRRDSFDPLGRRYPGYYLAGAQADLPERLSAAELRRLRIEAGWTGPALADAIGVRGSAVSRWETGARACPPARTAEIRRVLSSAPPLSASDERTIAKLETIARDSGGATRTELGWPARRRLVERAEALGRLWSDVVDVEDRRGRFYRRRLYFAAGTKAPERPERLSIAPAELREIRVRAGISQHALGALLGVANVTVSGWETGRVRVPPRHVRALRDLSDGRDLDRQSDRLSG